MISRLPLALAAAFCLSAALPLDGATADHAADKVQLREIKEVLWPKAYREQDTALLDRILADDFESIDAEGARSTKREELDYISKNKPSYDSFRFEIRRLQLYENGTAIVSGTGYIESKPIGGKKGTRTEYQSSNVFIKASGRWQAIASHVSGIKQTPLH